MTIDLTAQIHQYLTNAPSSLFTQQEVEIVAHWQGDSNLLWRVNSGREDAVVKQFLDAGQARSRRQYDGHQHFSPLGLAPQPLWADRYPHGLSRQLIVYRWSNGEQLAAEDTGELWSWAEAVATLHTAPTDDLHRFSPHPLNLDTYWRIEQGSIHQIENWLRKSDLPLAATFQQLATAAEALVHQSLPMWERALPTSVHGDLSHEHTLIERGRILFLDWEMFGLGDPALDVARLLQREGQRLTEEQRHLWLESYLQRMDQPELAQRLNIYQQLLEFHNVVYLLVGLQQHSTVQLDSELLAALPFLQSALTSALDRTFELLTLSERPDTASLTAAFFAWLVEARPTAS